mmetsp:Transcript_3368/g.9791  ORF Transcript_3368/g.9791 Transcript_3368/m.9791 type:complete len:241 (-) Transcript_3368:154-876(-)
MGEGIHGCGSNHGPLRGRTRWKRVLLRLPLGVVIRRLGLLRVPLLVGILLRVPLLLVWMVLRQWRGMLVVGVPWWVVRSLVLLLLVMVRLLLLRCQLLVAVLVLSLVRRRRLGPWGELGRGGKWACWLVRRWHCSASSPSWSGALGCGSSGISTLAPRAPTTRWHELDRRVLPSRLLAQARGVQWDGRRGHKRGLGRARFPPFAEHQKPVRPIPLGRGIRRRSLGQRVEVAAEGLLLGLA